MVSSSGRMLKNGSCAINGREPCQVGNQAALSGMFDVPRGSLFRVQSEINASEARSMFGYMILFCILRIVGLDARRAFPCR